MKVNFKLNFNLNKNLLPSLINDGIVYDGYSFSTYDGDIDTNIKAWQYLEASELFNAFAGSGKRKVYGFVGKKSIYIY